MTIPRHTPHIVWALIAASTFVVGRATVKKSSVTQEMLSLGQSAPSETSLLGASSSEADRQTAEGTLGGANGSATGEPLTGEALENLAKEAFKDPNPLKRSLAFAKLLESMTPENAQEIREQMRAQDAGGDQWRLFQYAWGAVDGEGALAASFEIENERYRNGALSSAISGWASSDPNGAIAWMNAMEDGDVKNRMQEGLVGGLADYSVSMASDYVVKLAADGNRRAPDLMADVASEQLRQSGARSSATWSENLPNGPLKGAAMDRVANAFVDEDPVAAAEWAEKYATAAYGARVIEEVGDEWAERKPAEAVAWLDSLPEGDGKVDGMQSALGEWARRDPTAASQYLTEMPDSPTKDAAISGFVSRVAWEDPTAAIAWAGTIGQEGQRQEALVRAGQAWYRRDREAATAWLETSGLPPEAQQKVTTSRDRRRG